MVVVRAWVTAGTEMNLTRRVGGVDYRTALLTRKAFVLRRFESFTLLDEQ